MNCFIKANGIEVWKFFINGLFIPIYYVNDKVVNIPNNLWNKKCKRNVKFDFKAKYLMMSALITGKYLYVFNYNSVKEV